MGEVVRIIAAVDIARTQAIMQTQQRLKDMLGATHPALPDAYEFLTSAVNRTRTRNDIQNACERVVDYYADYTPRNPA